MQRGLAFGACVHVSALGSRSTGDERLSDIEAPRRSGAAGAIVRLRHRPAFRCSEVSMATAGALASQSRRAGGFTSFPRVARGHVHSQRLSMISASRWRRYARSANRRRARSGTRRCGTSDDSRIPGALTSPVRCEYPARDRHRSSTLVRAYRESRLRPAARDAVSRSAICN